MTTKESMDWTWVARSGPAQKGPAGSVQTGGACGFPVCFEASDEHPCKMAWEQRAEFFPAAVQCALVHRMSISAHSINSI